ncbi:MAG: hypothetical protein ACTHY5_03395 [Oceanisphaera sp.]|uniref:hypothetical protein n=1 Tax=Oceanisphaera sp. TaxID=1929979 RepID=UPI003F945404
MIIDCPKCNQYVEVAEAGGYEQFNIGWHFRFSLSETSANILERLNIPQENWLKITGEFMVLFKGPAGSLSHLQQHCEKKCMQRTAYASSCRHWTH